MCGGHIEFPDHALGTTVACPHCAKTTRLKPSDLPLIESPAEEKLLAALPAASTEEDHPFRRPVIKLAFFALVLVLVLVAMIVAVNHFSKLATQRAIQHPQTAPPPVTNTSPVR